MKLDPRTIPYRVLANAGRVGALVVFSVVTSGAGGFGFGRLAGLLVVGLGLVVLWELTRYRRVDYELTDDTFDLSSGVFSRREREIPFHRIQNVDIGQNVLQRAFGLAELRLETAGGGSTEAQLRYVSREEADRLQNQISDRKRGVEPDEDDETVGETLFELSTREHLILGIVSADFRFVGALSVLAPVLAPQFAGVLGPETTLLLLLGGPAVALAALVGFWVLSGFLQVLRYYDFELTRKGDELRYERGLLQRYSGTVPLSKIQSVTLRENVLSRALGYGSLVIQTAGYAPGSGGSEVESAVPIARRERALALAREIEPFGDVSFDRPPKRARTRYAARYAIALVVLGGVFWLANEITGLLPLWYAPVAAVPAAPVAAHLKWKHRGYYADDEYVITRNGFWRRQITVVPYDRVQTIFSSQTVFQRRRNLGTVTVDTAGGGALARGDAVAVDIDATVADRLREEVADRLQTALAAGSRDRTHSASPASPSKTTKK